MNTRFITTGYHYCIAYTLMSSSFLLLGLLSVLLLFIEYKLLSSNTFHETIVVPYRVIQNSKRTRPLEIVSLDTLASKCHENGTVMITVTTFGYVDMTRDFYYVNHMNQYGMFFVVVMDMLSYQV